METIRRFTLDLSLGCGLFAAGCGEPPAEPEPPVRPVKIHVIGSLEPEAIIEYPGTIRAHQTAEMGFEVVGRVAEFLVREGDRVEKDAVLARLDPRDY
ncbi:MAG TPA: biotin/lipoyl-binding protein [Planctomycetes bacterium]|nr:biotin/lipoyl-binding protein [Planctomycetota bacterium]